MTSFKRESSVRTTGEQQSETVVVLTSVFALVDSLVELYLCRVIRPFVKLHETFYSNYSGLDPFLRKILNDNYVPEWFSANFISYFRTALVIPTLVLIAHQYFVMASIVCQLVDFGDFLDGVVARYWIDVKKAASEAMDNKDKKNKKDGSLSRASSPAGSDDDSFEVVTTGSPHSVQSWVVTHRNRTYGGLVDAVCDKAYVVPLWTILLSTVPTCSSLRLVQYATLLCLILAETASVTIRFQAYFTSTHPAPKVEGFDFFSTMSAVKADHDVEKAKQTFEMVGTSLFMISWTRYLGLLLLVLALPLAYESVRRTIRKRVIYVHHDATDAATRADGFDYKTLKFWMQAKSLGNKLIVGIPGNKMTDMVLNACASTSVDQVIVEAPARVDLHFLEQQGIDFCLFSAAQTKFVTDEVVNENCCLVIGEDGVARPVKTKTEHQD